VQPVALQQHTQRSPLFSELAGLTHTALAWEIHTAADDDVDFIWNGHDDGSLRKLLRMNIELTKHKYQKVAGTTRGLGFISKDRMLGRAPPLGHMESSTVPSAYWASCSQSFYPARPRQH